MLQDNVEVIYLYSSRGSSTFCSLKKIWTIFCPIVIEENNILASSSSSGFCYEKNFKRFERYFHFDDNNAMRNFRTDSQAYCQLSRNSINSSCVLNNPLNNLVIAIRGKYWSPPSLLSRYNLLLVISRSSFLPSKFF